jgi:D-alanyl-D-alanine carboxypeptidase (penicillin-binding protein 5/6)
LLPSANNIAVMLARHVAGSERSFVARMNVTAAALGMQDTTYTDPSGLDSGTRSTAHDQVVLASIAMRNATFADLVSLSVATIPVAGRVYNTDHLLGVDGFVGIKTGSDDAAGGCFVFRTWRVVNGTVEPITGVVLGQRGHNLIDAALAAARQFANRIAPTVASAAGKGESP